MQGTNLGTAPLTSTVNPIFVDGSGYGILVTAPSAGAVATVGYQTGCVLIETTVGMLYINTGASAGVVPTWTKVGSQS